MMSMSEVLPLFEGEQGRERGRRGMREREKRTLKKNMRSGYKLIRTGLAMRGC